MKTKKFLSLLLATLMACGMFACGGGNDSSVDSTPSGSPSSENAQPDNSGETSDSGEASDGGEQGGPVEKTDDELYALVKEAVTATQAYTGAVTATAATKMVEGEGMSSIMSGKYSFDPATKLSYVTEESESEYKMPQEEETSEDTTQKNVSSTTSKVFKSGDAYYSYDKSVGSSMWSNYESYTLLHERSSSLEVGEDMDIGFIVSMVAGGVFLADTYTELTSAFDTTYEAAIANTIAAAKEDAEDGGFNAEEGDKLGATPTVTIVEEDGAVTLTISSLVEMTDAGEDGSQIMKLLMDRSFTAKEGKISEVALAINVDMTMSYPAEDSAEPLTMSQKMEMEMSYAVEYAFDQAGYDAITVTLPAEEEISVETMDYGKSLTVMFGDVAMDEYISSYAETPSYADALNGMKSSIEQQFTEGSYNDQGGYEEVQLLTIEGFYLDKELTKPLDPTALTEEEYYALETVYAKYTVAEGYFIYSSEYEDVEQYSKPYQIVMGVGFGASYASAMLQIYRVSDYESGYNVYPGEGETVLLNGVQLEETSFVPESGKTYLVVYKSVMTDADVTILDLVGGLAF